MHLVSEIFNQQAGVDTVHVPYCGAAPTLQDLLAGQIDYYFDPASGFSHIREGRAQLLAVTGMKRSPFFPDAPRLAEAGIQGVELGSQFGLFAPADVVARLDGEIGNAVALPGVKQHFAERGVEPVAQNAVAIRKIIADELRLLAALIKDPRIAVDCGP